VARLIESVQGFVVRRAGLPHLPEDFQPALPQAAQGGRVGHFVGAFLLVVGLGLGAAGAAEIGPEMDGGAEVFVAGAAEPDLVHLAGGERDRARKRG
jgi:hypothetical protein